jgi:nucleotide-binding universal stress UspA family protein
MKILLCTDGSPAALKAVDLLQKLMPLEAMDLTLLGVGDEGATSTTILTSFDKIEAALGGKRPGWQRLVRVGAFVKQVALAAHEQPYDLVALGESRSHLRSLWLLKFPSFGERLSNRLEVPLLVAREAPRQLRKVLICTSAKDPAEIMLRTAGQWIAPIGVEVGLLHVMSQMALLHTASEVDLLDTAETAITRRTPEGRHLQRAVEILRQQGVTAAITPRIRHGLVLDEVVAEISEGRYDLLIIGAHHRPGYDPRLEKLLEDVARDLISDAPCSVIVV